MEARGEGQSVSTGGCQQGVSSSQLIRLTPTSGPGQALRRLLNIQTGGAAWRRAPTESSSTLPTDSVTQGYPCSGMTVTLYVPTLRGETILRREARVERAVSMPVLGLLSEGTF